jgi:hypothetical protein
VKGLPEQEHMDVIDGRLSVLQDAMDRVQTLTTRAGLARTLAAQTEDEQLKRGHEESLADVAVRWPEALMELERQAKVAAKWTRVELSSLSS